MKRSIIILFKSIGILSLIGIFCCIKNNAIKEIHTGNKELYAYNEQDYSKKLEEFKKIKNYIDSYFESNDVIKSNVTNKNISNVKKWLTLYLKLIKVF